MADGKSGTTKTARAIRGETWLAGPPPSREPFAPAEPYIALSSEVAGVKQELSKSQTTVYAVGQRVGCHMGNYERPGYILGAGRISGSYSVRIVGLGVLDV